MCAMTHLAQGNDAPRPRRTGRQLAVPGLLALTSAFALVFAACSPAAPTGAPTGTPSGGPSAAPSPGPSAAPTTGAIAHKTGSKDIVLRVEEVGGFVPLEFMTTYTPSFTLYGDGTVIWRDNLAAPPESSDNLIRATELRIAKLDEASIQTVLEQAIGSGGLGVAQGTYGQAGGDMTSTVFTIEAGDLREPKRVEVIGMSPDLHPQDAQIIRALVGLAEQLRTFDTLVPGQLYNPAAWRGVLIPTEQAFGPVVDWPWTDVSADDFGGDNEFFRELDLSAEQVAAIGIKDLAGGVSGFVLQDGDDLYSFGIRPLLPDELG
jgi:hypothetical protein